MKEIDMHYRIISVLLDKINEIKEIHIRVEHNTDFVLITELEQCQEKAMSMGELIEKQENVDLTIIAMLEKYCELLYELSLDYQSYTLYEMKNIINELEKYIVNIPMKYRVVFLPYKAEMWDSLESIWRAFVKDDRFLCSVVPIPYFEANGEKKEWEMCYDGDLFPDDVPIVKYSDYDLKEKKPDLAFVHNPFDKYNYVTSVYMDYYSWELKKNVFRLVYVPYYANMGCVYDTYRKLPSLKMFDYMIFQSDIAKDTCKGEGYYDKILPLGSPKFDRIINTKTCKEEMPKSWKKIIGERKIILLNTTISELYVFEEHLIKKLHSFFERVKDNNKICIIWRPHPLLEATIKATRTNLISKYEHLKHFFIDNEIGIYDTNQDISKIIHWSDGYAGSSCSSMITLFLIINKPVFLFQGKNLFIRENEQKKRAIECFRANYEHDYWGIREEQFYTIEDFMEDLSEDRLFEVSIAEKRVAKSISANLDGTCGQNTHDVLVELLEKELWGED